MEKIRFSSFGLISLAKKAAVAWATGQRMGREGVLSRSPPVVELKGFGLITHGWIAGNYSQLRTAILDHLRGGNSNELPLQW